ncbi:MAG: thioesterase family protein [Flavobacteriales bacterium]|nr:thioesterase family protein [Flavobacteriales bacterium]
MYQFTVNIRVRYAETDQMGYCYYGNYAQYFEVARVETLRSLGVSYKDLENSGILLPVSEYNIKYILPALYDEQLSINCAIKEITEFKIIFDYKTHNEEDKLLNFGSTTLVFVDKQTKKPVNCPSALKSKLKNQS